MLDFAIRFWRQLVVTVDQRHTAVVGILASLLVVVAVPGWASKFVGAYLLVFSIAGFCHQPAPAVEDT